MPAIAGWRSRSESAADGRADDLLDHGHVVVVLGQAGQRVQRVREPVEVLDQLWTHSDGLAHGQHPALGAPNHRPRAVQGCGRDVPAGDDELPLRARHHLAHVDQVLEVLHVCGANGVGEDLPALGVAGEFRRDDEEPLLDAVQGRPDRLVHRDGLRLADRGVGLVDGAVGLHARILLGHARAAEQAGQSGVAGARVDVGHRLLLLDLHRVDDPDDGRVDRRIGAGGDPGRAAAGDDHRLTDPGADRVDRHLRQADVVAARCRGGR